MSPLYQILVWVKQEGGVKSIERLKMKVLQEAVQHGVAFGHIGPTTQAPPAFLKALRIAASSLVGKSCPF